MHVSQLFRVKLMYSKVGFGGAYINFGYHILVDLYY